jgi:hypothetical protein
LFLQLLEVLARGNLRHTQPVAQLDDCYLVLLAQHLDNSFATLLAGQQSVAI